MTSKEYVLSAVCHVETDRIPITFDAQAEVYAALYRHLGVTTKEALFDKLHVDTWMILPGNYEFPEAEKNKPEKTSIWGYRKKATAYSGGTYDEVVCFPLAGKDRISDIRAHPWPSPEVLDFSQIPEEARKHANRAIIVPVTWGAYHIAAHVRGLEDLLMDFALRPEYLEHLLGTISEISLAAHARMLENYSTGVDIVYMADDYCSQLGPLFSPAGFKRFIMPYLTRTVDLVHRYGKKFLLHVCGAVRPLLPMIVDAGVDMLEPIQTRAAGMDPRELKRDFGKHLCFYGGVDLQQTLAKGTTRQVADEVRMLIDVLGEGGGYVLGPGHTYIQVDAPLENIMAMYTTAYTHRRKT
ncbi:MAG: hypothetical protein N2255_01270 [Kiritimatiellae bacterium]|nr:hypothetical protein [Kiritimatiellia bacterium]